ncbi:MAG: MarR family transcriptional regulator [Thermostichales cyanobacterium BF4_bins_65]
MRESLNGAQQAAQESFLPLLRQLVRTYQMFEQRSHAHIRQLGLTAAQFDVIATLGNTQGMTMNVLAEKTLVTKGTLTGIVDRLEQKGLVQREVPPEDRRCFTIRLTPTGEALFHRTFPQHIAYLKQFFQQLSPDEQRQIQNSLAKLETVLAQLPTDSSPELDNSQRDAGDHG